MKKRTQTHYLYQLEELQMTEKDKYQSKSNRGIAGK